MAERAGGMGVCKDHAFCGESLNIGHLNLRVGIKRTGVPISHVINKNEYDIWMCFFFQSEQSMPGSVKGAKTAGKR
jgi:hypothetical protein